MNNRTMYLVPIILIFFVLIVSVIFTIGVRTSNSGLERADIVVGSETFTVELANTPFSRAEGLSGREHLGRNEGMLFIFSKPRIQTFWMKGMIISIDIIWILDGTIVGLHERVEPEPGVPLADLLRYSSPKPANRVLEVPSGTVERLGISVGDEIITP